MSRSKRRTMRKKVVAKRTIKLISVGKSRKEIWIGDYMFGDLKGFPDDVVNSVFESIDEEMLKTIHQILWNYTEDIGDLLRMIVAKHHPELKEELKSMKLNNLAL